MIYLDNAATTRMDEEVLAEMLPYLSNQYGNPGSVHKFGRETKNAVDLARKRVADFIGAKPNQIIFTSGGSEANNLAMFGTLSYLNDKPHRKLIISDKAEHSSLLKALSHACELYGFEPRVLDITSDGKVDLEQLEAYLASGNVEMVSIMHTNNELGSVNNVQKIGKMCHETGVLFHTDCVQAAGFSKLDVNNIDCDMMSLSSHKIHGGKGLGCLYVRNPKLINPLVYGGKNQEFGKRGGTENVPGIVAFGKACEIAMRDLEHNRKYISKLSETLATSLDSRFTLNSNDEYNKVVNLRVDGCDAETISLFLENKGIMISAGSACDSREHNPSHVLKALGLSDSEARQSLRISFSKYNTLSDVEKFIKALNEALNILSSI